MLALLSVTVGKTDDRTPGSDWTLGDWMFGDRRLVEAGRTRSLLLLLLAIPVFGEAELERGDRSEGEEAPLTKALYSLRQTFFQCPAMFCTFRHCFVFGFP